MAVYRVRDGGVVGSRCSCSAGTSSWPSARAAVSPLTTTAYTHPSGEEMSRQVRNLAC